MKVIALAIEPGSCDASFPKRLAKWMGLRLADYQKFECELAERTDFRQAKVSVPLPPIGRPPRSGRQMSMTPAQLNARYVEQVMQTIADGDVLIVGWSAPIIARSLQHVLRVRVGAAPAQRLRGIMKRFAYGDERVADLELQAIDGQICRAVHRMTSTCWRTENHFDLQVNVDRMGEPHCLHAIASLARSPVCGISPAALIELEAEVARCAATDGSEELLLRRPSIASVPAANVRPIELH